MTKLKDKLIKEIKAEIEEVNAQIEAVKEEVKLPTPEEASKLTVVEENPILKMAIEQAEFRRIKDLYHGFK